jgi:hypothetical protein
LASKASRSTTANGGSRSAVAASSSSCNVSHGIRLALR